jgi:hypothetical protein
MNSYENPQLSYECDLTAERDRLREINKVFLAALEEIEDLAKASLNSGGTIFFDEVAVYDTARAAIAKATNG